MYKVPVLSIAASDCSGGAGIQADTKAIQATGAYAMSAITAITAQNTVKVKAVYPLSALEVRSQLDAVLEDIPPLSIKVGVVYDVEQMEAIIEALDAHGFDGPLVIDTILKSSSGQDLLKADAQSYFIERFLPRASLLTPNLPEAHHLAKFLGLDRRESGEHLAQALGRHYRASVLVKGGHSKGDPIDYLYNAETKLVTPFLGRRIHSQSTHGTGCTLASAIASYLAQGASLEVAVEKAKQYLSLALEQGLELGKGCGPLNHNCLQDDLEPR